MKTWRHLAGVGAALLAVMMLAYIWRETAEPTEIFWTMLGAGGSVFAFQICRRRWRVNAWRKRQGINGLFAIAAQGSAVLRTSGLIAEMLILIGGVSAMMTPQAVRVELQINDAITTATVIGLAVCVTFSAWYADRQAQQAEDYQVQHPEIE